MSYLNAIPEWFWYLAIPLAVAILAVWYDSRKWSERDTRWNKRTFDEYRPNSNPEIEK